MKNSIFIIKIFKGESKVISCFGYNNGYSNMEDGLEATLRGGKIIFQTQSDPDSEGIVYVTISIEKS